MDRDPGLQVIICSGPGDAKRAVLGFAVAAAAVACGTAVRIFLTMDGARWALECEGNEPVAPGFQSIAEMIGAIQSGDGKIEVCSACAGALKGLPRRPGCSARCAMGYGWKGSRVSPRA
jgi:predicted peroxiredoxin